MTYRIVRFRFKGNRRVMRRGLSLAEAQAHCQRADTTGVDREGRPWFEGYEAEAERPSAQAEWERANRAAGLCRCGRPPREGMGICVRCTLKQSRAYFRRKARRRKVA